MKSISMAGALLIGVLGFSCERNVDCCVPPPVDLIPLQVGNSWTMKPKPATEGVDAEFSMIYKVDRRDLIDGQEYFRVVLSVGTPESNTQEIQYYRVLHNEVFIREENSDEEEIIYHLDAKSGEQWSYSTGQMRLAGISEYEFVNADTTLFDCRSFEYDNTQLVDEEYRMVMAPHLGFVSFSSARLEMELSEALIGGKKHTFN